MDVLLWKRILILALAVAAYDHSPTEEQIREWSEYKAKYDKTYNPSEDEVRFRTYLRNKEFIEEHNELFKTGQYKYKLSINHLTDMDSFEVHSTIRGHRSYTSVNATEFEKALLMGGGPVPDQMDWRTKGAVSPVKNQGTVCGSCYAFSTTGALESHYYILTKKKVELSEQYIIDCSTTDFVGNHGCSGGNAFFALRFTMGSGCVPENSTRTSKRGCVSGVETFGDLRVTDIRLVRTEEDLKRVIAQRGPVTVGIDASDEKFNFYGGGIYHNDRCNNAPISLNHAMLVVGYGSEDGEDYWILKNSWGKHWGEEGYVRLIRNRDNECGIVTLALFPIVESLGNPAGGNEWDSGAFIPLPPLTLLLIFQFISVWPYIR